MLDLKLGTCRVTQLPARASCPLSKPSTALVLPPIPTLTLVCISTEFYGNEADPQKPAAYQVFWWVLSIELEGALPSPLVIPPSPKTQGLG